MAASSREVLVRALTAALLVLVPVVAVSLSPWRDATGLLVLSLLPTLTALAAGPRATTAAALATGLTGFLAVLAAGAFAPVTGTLLVVVLAYLTATVSPRGYHAVGAATIAFAAYLLVDPSRVVEVLDAQAPRLAVAALVLATTVLAGAWALLVRAVLLRGIRLPIRTAPATLPYGVLLAALCGAFMLVCLVWFRGTNAWWAVMTVALILQPTHADTRTRLGGRLAGTMLGGTAAALVAIVLPGVGAATMLGVLAALASVVLTLAGGAYWLCTTATTISVVLLTFEPSDRLAGDLARVGITLVAAGVTAGAVWLAARLAPVPD
ncbi:MAG: hypothetical protein BGO96_13800 [Micrococcales bacterium 73-15]|nr:MAG: hypothetical protein BGO96_13800 [Micrococcales bacterium 73-15]